MTYERNDESANGGYDLITMNGELLNIFLSEDGDAHVRHEPLDAILNRERPGAPIVREFTSGRPANTRSGSKNSNEHLENLTRTPDGRIT